MSRKILVLTLFVFSTGLLSQISVADEASEAIAARSTPDPKLVSTCTASPEYTIRPLSFSNKPLFEKNKKPVAISSIPKACADQFTADVKEKLTTATVAHDPIQKYYENILKKLSGEKVSVAKSEVAGEVNSATGKLPGKASDETAKHRAGTGLYDTTAAPVKLAPAHGAGDEKPKE